MRACVPHSMRSHAPRGGGGDDARRSRRSAASAASGGELQPLPARSSPSCLHVFDFDSTLVETQLPERGAQEWLRATGTPWPHNGWWGRPESLSPLLPTRPGPALAAYHAAVADASAVVTMLTGRRAHLADAVRACLALHGVSALHSQHYNDTRLDTMAFKADVLRALCRCV